MTNDLQRRMVLGGAVAGAAMLSGGAFAQPGVNPVVIPWSDQPPPVPPPLASVIKGQSRWEDLDGWITPNDRFFSIAHYNRPVIDEKAWRLDVTGMVGKPLTLPLTKLKALPRKKTINTTNDP